MPPVRKAVITAAGLGTRFLPITKAQPKEMLPLVDKPTIQYSVEEAIASGIEQVIFVTGGGKRAIVDHFDRNLELEFYLRQRGKPELLKILEEVDALSDRVHMAWVQQKEPLGLGHAIYQAHPLIGNEPCAVVLPDDVILGAVPCLKQLISAYAHTGATVIAARRVQPDQVSRYGIFAVKPSGGPIHEVEDLVEKPSRASAPSNLAIIGRYVLTPAVFAELNSSEQGAGQEIQLTDAIKRTLGTHPVVALEFEGDYYDTGTVPGYLQATLTLAMKRDGLREQLAPLLRDLLGKGPGETGL
jgi:UTP--glucose-1-phosphate uridylyltransferase